MMKNKSFLIGMALFIFFCLMAGLATFWTPYSYQEVFDGAALLKPSARFLLGTDDLGRDLFSRLLVGAQLSLGIGIFVGGLSVVVGASLGIISAYYGKKLDQALVQMMNGIQALPSLLLALFVVAILGGGILNVILSVTLVSIPVMFRLVRSAALVENSKDYIVAARAVGASDFRIITAHLFPNCITPILVQSAVCCSEAILNTAALGFLGLGIPAPYPEWGTMLSDSKNFIETAPQLMTIPGLCLLLLILSTQLISDGLRDHLDPKLRGRS
ncbi:MAG: ABC transporter permease [Bdellovibrio sp.]|nr:ABC transporter permease [Bdellovibrio sp.]